LKYETPFRSTNRLDVPRQMGPRLADPSVTLWFTEGAKKVDAATSVGIACVGLSGTYGWMQTDPETKGKVALRDFYSVALNGREVVIAFDSDVMTKDEVRKALQGFRRFLESRGARPLVCMLPSENGKVGLDDYLAGGGTRDALESLVVPRLPDDGAGPVTPRNRVQPRNRPLPNHPRSLTRQGSSTVSRPRFAVAAWWARNATPQPST
jgi:Domain of unknown function (DUF3854)